MISWDEFIFFGLPAIALWIFSAFLTFFKKNSKKIALLIWCLASAIFASFIAILWAEYSRAPMLTMGETRLWYSFFVSVAAAVIFYKWEYKIVLGLGAILASVFVIINLAKPEIHTRALAPVLQSAWFVPHVVVYMLAYALTACATALAIWNKFKKNVARNHIRHLTEIASALLLTGMLFGAFWAKQAWGHYWEFDIKETWAAISWFTILLSLHSRREKLADGFLFLAFLCFNMCWYGISYLPLSVNSNHLYN